MRFIVKDRTLDKTWKERQRAMEKKHISKLQRGAFTAGRAAK